MSRLFLALIRLYQATVSWVLPARCRFHPSCSHYAEEAIRVHGALRGSALAVWRLLRCQPLARPGYDPVPGAPSDSSPASRSAPR